MLVPSVLKVSGEVGIADGHPGDFVEEEEGASGFGKESREVVEGGGPVGERDLWGVELAGDSLGEVLELGSFIEIGAGRKAGDIDEAGGFISALGDEGGLADPASTLTGYEFGLWVL